ncbi:hypothetical protein [Vreelandella glaciei]|uniref:hypothetical protein n=1 Tax=Vreelandella glaciei TaxID=186761 RepID=UPI00300373B2
MNTQAAKVFYDLMKASQINSAFTCMLLQSTELALAVNLQGKYAVQLETTPQGIFCETWLAARNAQHESHRRFDCFYQKTATAIDEICEINSHLSELLVDSAGGAA